MISSGTYSPIYKETKKRNLRASEWVFPRSGIIFTWVKKPFYDVPEESIKTECNIDKLKKDYPYLKNTLKVIDINLLENDFRALKGLYHAYLYFDPIDNENTGKIAISLYEIYDIDIKTMVLKCRKSTIYDGVSDIEGCWEYDGYIIKAKNKLFFLLECLPDNHYF